MLPTRPVRYKRRQALAIGAGALLSLTLAACQAIQPGTTAPQATPMPEPTTEPTAEPTTEPTTIPTEEHTAHEPESESTPMPEMEQADEMDAEATPAPGPGTGLSFEVEIRLFAFQQANLEIPAGATVIWTNVDDIDHSVTSGVPDAPDGRFDSGLFPLNEQFSHTFLQPGEYPYYCTRHPHMVGVVVVTAE